jgi:hypothetical protein
MAGKNKELLIKKISKDAELLGYHYSTDIGLDLESLSNLKTILTVFVAGQTQDKSLGVCNNNVKENLKVWIKPIKMLSDSYAILDAKIVNFGIDYTVLLQKNYDRLRALQDSTKALNDLFSVKLEVGQSFDITQIYNTLKRVTGVVDVTGVHIYQKKGGAYSTVAFDISQARSPDGRFINCPGNVIFEVKYPTLDVQGAAR